MVLFNYIRANRGALLFLLFWQGIFCAVGLVMVLVINGFLNDEANYACMGTLFCLVGVLVGTLARGNVAGHTRFALALSMGQTRRSYLLCDPIQTVLTGVIGLLVAWVVYQTENCLYAWLYPGFINDMPLDVVFRWQVMAVVLPVMVVLDLFFSALVYRFGARSFGVVWLAFCMSFLLLPRMVDAAQSGGTSLLARMGGGLMWAVEAMPVSVWIVLAAALAVAMLTFGVLIFRKAEVKI